MWKDRGRIIQAGLTYGILYEDKATRVKAVIKLDQADLRLYRRS